MYTQQDKTSYTMQESSWLQAVSIPSERYGDTSDIGNPLWYQSYCLQMLWRSSWQTSATDTASNLKNIIHTFQKTSAMRSICRVLILKSNSDCNGIDFTFR